jgi:hypothetical protein
MSRSILTERDVRLANARASALPGALPPNTSITTVELPPAPMTSDDYKTRLLKYIPGDVVALYVMCDTLIRTFGANAGERELAYAVVVSVGFVGTPLYLWKFARVRKGLQLGVSTMAFVVWVYALGGPFAGLAWYEEHKLLSALALPIFTFAAALLEP